MRWVLVDFVYGVQRMVTLLEGAVDRVWYYKEDE